MSETRKYWLKIISAAIISVVLFCWTSIVTFSVQFAGGSTSGSDTALTLLMLFGPSLVFIFVLRRVFRLSWLIAVLFFVASLLTPLSLIVPNGYGKVVSWIRVQTVDVNRCNRVLEAIKNPRTNAEGNSFASVTQDDADYFDSVCRFSSTVNQL